MISSMETGIYVTCNPLDVQIRRLTFKASYPNFTCSTKNTFAIQGQVDLCAHAQLFNTCVHTPVMLRYGILRYKYSGNMPSKV